MEDKEGEGERMKRNIYERFENVFFGIFYSPIAASFYVSHFVRCDNISDANKAEMKIVAFPSLHFFYVFFRWRGSFFRALLNQDLDCTYAIFKSGNGSKDCCHTYTHNHIRANNKQSLF